MTLNNPSLKLTFLGNDLAAGHSPVQTITDEWIVNHSILPSRQLLNGLKSSSDQYQLIILRKCPSIEDIIATEGNIKAELSDGSSILFTGYVSTSYTWTLTDHGEQALKVSLESIGSRLFSQPFIESGYFFFDTTASAAVYEMITPLGLSFREGDERKILQPVSHEVEAGQTVRELLDQMFYECDSVYSFNNLGELCVMNINPSTTGAQIVNSAHLFNLRGRAISVSKALRTYKGARVKYTETSKASNYLVYRNTTGADDRHPYCYMKLGPGEWFDGAEIYTDAEWSAATADTFREPTLISAVNAGSESSIVGSGQIISISNAKQNVVAEAGITVQIQAVGGKWFKITAHNSSASDQYIERMDLYADIVYEKSIGVIRTQIDGPTDGKSLLEEDLLWIHDKTNAQRHANMLAQYYKNCGATYTFYSDLNLTLGSVIRLQDNVFSGLDVYVLVYASKGMTDSELLEYKAVGISTFNLDADVFHGTNSIGSQSAAQGPKGESGSSAQVQYALGTSPTVPPTEKMLWADADMEWNGVDMLWDAVAYSDTVPVPSDGQYVWMRTRVGDSEWQYMRLTGEEGESAKVWDFLMSSMTYTVDHRKSGNNPAITLDADVQGYSITPSWEVRDANNTDRSSWLSATTGSSVTLSIPYDNAAPWPLSVKMKGSGMDTVTKQLTGVDVTTYNYDIGVWSGPSLPQYIDYPTNTKKVSSGDYFVAGAEFIVSGVPYKAGYAYYYNGSSWAGLDLSNQENAKKALNLLSDLSSADVQIPSSDEVYSVWLWTKNFVAQNAVIQNLFAEKITILDDGCIHSDYYNDDGTINTASTATSGFWLGANGELKCESGEMNNLKITGDSSFEGRFDTGVLNTVVKPVAYTLVPNSTLGESIPNNASQADALALLLKQKGFPMGTRGTPSNTDNLIRCDIEGVTSPVYYIRYYYESGESYVSFFGSSKNFLNIRDYVACTSASLFSPPNYLTSRSTNATWANNGIVLKIGSGGNLLEIHVPDSDYASGNIANTLFVGPVTTVNNISCRPVYMKV